VPEGEDDGLVLALAVAIDEMALDPDESEAAPPEWAKPPVFKPRRGRRQFTPQFA